MKANIIQQAFPMRIKIKDSMTGESIDLIVIGWSVGEDEGHESSPLVVDPVSGGTWLHRDEFVVIEPR